FADTRKILQAVATGHVEIKEHQIHGRCLHPLQKFSTIPGSHDHIKTIVSAFEQGGQSLSQDLMIIGNGYPEYLHGCKSKQILRRENAVEFFLCIVKYVFSYVALVLLAAILRVVPFFVISGLSSSL